MAVCVHGSLVTNFSYLNRFSAPYYNMQDNRKDHSAQEGYNKIE